MRIARCVGQSYNPNVTDSLDSAPAERRLLVACARAWLGTARREDVVEILAEGMHWPRLVALAADEGVAPLVFLQLECACGELLPADWRETFRAERERAARRNLYLSAELLRVLDAIATAGVPAIPYKGAILAVQAYGDLALRQFADLDIIVRQCDIPAAHRAMLALGYQPEVADPTAQDAPRRPGQYQFRRELGPSIVEIHTEATLRYFPVAPDLDAHLARLRPILLGGAEVHTFALEDALSFLAVHGTKHFWERLCWVVDFAALVRADMDWATAITRAKSSRAARMLRVGLSVAEFLLGVPLPEAAARFIREDRASRTLAEEIVTRYAAPSYIPRGLMERLLFRARVPGGFFAGIRYAARLAAAPTEEDAGGAARRSVRLLKKYGLTGRGASRPGDASDPDEILRRIARPKSHGAAG